MPRRARRKPFRRRSTRRAWLEVLESREPELAEELKELRRYNPHAYRKRILQLYRRMDLTTASAVYAPAGPDEEPNVEPLEDAPSEDLPTEPVKG